MPTWPLFASAPNLTLQVLTRRLWVVAGVVDAGLASLATFAVGAYAVRTLAPENLGAYALAFRAVFLCAVVPTQLFFVPSEVLVVAAPESDRVRYLRRTLQLGIPPTLLAALAVSGWCLFVPGNIPSSVVLGLTGGAIATGFFSPIQDHLRRMLHAGGRSWAATMVSASHVVATVGALLACHALSLPAWWIPLTALAIGNATSLALGAILSWTPSPVPGAGVELGLARVVQSGKWLVIIGLLEPGTGFLTSAMLSHLAGAAALGYAEAARVVAQPLMVLAWGLSSVLGPRLIAAAGRGQLQDARRTSGRFVATVLLLGGLFLLLFSHEWKGNPLSWFLPTAYTVGGLVFLTCLAYIVDAMVYPYRYEMLGGRREATLLRIELGANTMRTLVATGARELHAFAIALGLLCSAVVRWIGMRRALRSVYSQRSDGNA